MTGAPSMNRSLFTTAVITLTCAASLAAGEGFLTKWPKSGTWVKYAVTQEVTRRGVSDTPQAGELTVRFLEADPEGARRVAGWSLISTSPIATGTLGIGKP
jgi:hypothetical protein